MGGLKVEVDVERLDEVGDGIGVLVVLLLDNANNVLELLLVLTSVTGAGAVGDDSGGQVSEDPGAGSLDSVDEWCGEEEIADSVASWLVVEEWEESPVDEPCAVVQLCEWVAEELGVYGLLDLCDLLHSRFPVGGKNLRSKLSPGCSGNLVVIGGEDSELVKKLGSCSVITAAVLEVSEVVKNVDLLWVDLNTHISFYSEFCLAFL